MLAARWWVQDFVSGAPNSKETTSREDYFRTNREHLPKRHLQFIQGLLAKGVKPTYTITEKPEAIAWETMPASVDPCTFMKPERGHRKRKQVENMIQLARCCLDDSANKRPAEWRPVIVDFCAGSGHLAFPLAYLFPNAQVFLVERNSTAIAKAHERKTLLGLSNITIYHGSLETFTERFDLALGVHACGFLTDIIHAKALEHGAAYVLCPCCVGKLRLNTLAPITYPRSTMLQHLVSKSDYLDLASLADYGGWDFESPEAIDRRACKSFIEFDRNKCAEENGYETFLLRVDPPEATPKNDLIVGFKKTLGSLRVKNTTPLRTTVSTIPS
eukprot:GILJ01010283.1.p1 GENE.GILJ01010283.1~~GILJ01010283.1.p1  ORF type:complete len:330 (-),score=26.49 GILJ01010283.1:48-1037(-)